MKNNFTNLSDKNSASAASAEENSFINHESSLRRNISQITMMNLSFAMINDTFCFAHPFRVTIQVQNLTSTSIKVKLIKEKSYLAEIPKNIFPKSQKTDRKKEKVEDVCSLIFISACRRWLLMERVKEIIIINILTRNQTRRCYRVVSC